MDAPANKSITKDAFAKLVDSAIKEDKAEIVGVVAKGTRFAFSGLDAAAELTLDYDVTILPPKKYFLPPAETVLAYTPKDASSYKLAIDAPPRVIIGLHPYDLAAIHFMDQAFVNEKKDDHYTARRVNTTLIGSYPTREYKYRFAASADNAEPAVTADAMLCDLGDAYGVEVFTDKGKAFFGSALEKADGIADKIAKNKNKVKDGQKLPLAPAAVAALLDANEESPVFEKRAELCYSCGSCTLVCPTCYCYNMVEELDLDLAKGQRRRVWDGCVLPGFAEVAGGHNFRKTKADRFKHRIYRKGKYLAEKFGVYGCVGCGRCAGACTSDIANPVAVLEEVFKTAGKKVKAAASVVGEAVKAEVKAADQKLLLPAPAELVRKVKMTELETLFEFKFDGRDLGHKPGQFAEISIPGIGEAPISITSSPAKKGSFEMVIRKAGAVTAAVHGLNAGDKVGIRGPYGTEFPVADLKGKDLLFVTGGIGLVPARSAILPVLENRKDYGHVTIMFGTKDPSQRLFKDELAAWDKRDDVEFLETVDKGDAGWKGNVGVVTTLFDKLAKKPDPAATYAIIVGPPIMYKFVIHSLRDLKFSDDHIIVSLERHMKCGVGQCGHCQINNIYVCQDGPVFTLSQIADLPEAI